MKNYSLMILAVLLMAVGCKKDDVAVSDDGKITGNVNGAPVGFATVSSEISGTGGDQALYIVARKNFEGYNKPATDGKQLLVRIQPYKGVGKYNTSAQGFWVYQEKMNVVNKDIMNWTTHRYSDSETTGNINLEITSDKTEGGKRVIRGTFSGESGATIKVVNSGQTNETLVPLKFAEVVFAAPEKKM